MNLQPRDVWQMRSIRVAIGRGNGGWSTNGVNNISNNLGVLRQLRTPHPNLKSQLEVQLELQYAGVCWLGCWRSSFNKVSLPNAIV